VSVFPMRYERRPWPPAANRVTKKHGVAVLWQGGVRRGRPVRQWCVLRAYERVLGDVIDGGESAWLTAAGLRIRLRE